MAEATSPGQGDVDAPGTVIRQANEPRAASLEALRGLAAVAVVVDHTLKFGYAPVIATLNRAEVHIALRLSVSVVVFFALSGFLIFRPFARALLWARPMPDLGAYYRNRALRILPLYYLVLAVFVVAVDPAARLLHSPRRLLIFGTLTQNYFPDTIHGGIDPTWTLVLEVAFYVLVPLAAMSRFRRPLAALGQRGLALGVVGLYLVSAMAQLLLHLLLRSVFGVRYGTVTVWTALFPVEAYLFAGGMLVAVLSLDQGWLKRMPAWLQSRSTWLLGAAVGFGAMLLAPEALVYPVTSIPAALLLCALVLELRGGGLPLRLLSSRPLAGLGLISYGIYLWHAVVISLLNQLHLIGRDYHRDLALVLAITLAVSTLSYLLVERPFLMLRRRWAS